MHEAEKVLDFTFRFAFVSLLSEIQNLHEPAFQKESNAMDRAWMLVHTTAAQRAEAFLRTIGKWEES